MLAVVSDVLRCYADALDEPRTGRSLIQ